MPAQGIRALGPQVSADSQEPDPTSKRSTLEEKNNERKEEDEAVAEGPAQSADSDKPLTSVRRFSQVGAPPEQRKVMHPATAENPPSSQTIKIS